MIRLLSAEAHRWRARRGMWIVVAVAVGLCLLISLPMALAARPPSGADIDRARANYQVEKANWDANHDQYLADCKRNPPPAGGPTCEEMVQAPTESDFVPQPLKFADASKQGIEIGAGLGALFALIAAASFVGAEYRHGTLANWLTFVPGRPRVWLSKAIVVVVAGVLITLVCEALLLGAAAGAVGLLQGASALTTAVPALEIGARGLALGGLAGLVGLALAMLFRQTVAPIMLPLGYLILQGVMGLFRLIPGFRYVAPWLPEHNVQAFLEGQATVTVWEEMVSDQGLQNKPYEQVISLGQGVAYVVVGVALLTVASLVSFGRRDVA